MNLISYTIHSKKGGQYIDGCVGLSFTRLATLACMSYSEINNMIDELQCIAIEMRKPTTPEELHSND